MAKRNRSSPAPATSSEAWPTRSGKRVGGSPAKVSRIRATSSSRSASVVCPAARRTSASVAVAVMISIRMSTAHEAS